MLAENWQNQRLEDDEEDYRILKTVDEVSRRNNRTQVNKKDIYPGSDKMFDGDDNVDY